MIDEHSTAYDTDYVTVDITTDDVSYTTVIETQRAYETTTKTVEEAHTDVIERGAYTTITQSETDTTTSTTVT